MIQNRLEYAVCTNRFPVTSNQLTGVEVQTLFVELGSSWENGTIESFNGKLRDELLDRERFDTSLEAKALIKRWPRHYHTVNTVWPHSSLGHRPPAPEAILTPT